MAVQSLAMYKGGEQVTVVKVGGGAQTFDCVLWQRLCCGLMPTTIGGCRPGHTRAMPG